MAITHVFTNTTKVIRIKGHGLRVPNKDGRPIQVSCSQKPGKETAYHGGAPATDPSSHFSLPRSSCFYKLYIHQKSSELKG